MNQEEFLNLLQVKDTSQSYAALQEAERLSEESNQFYGYMAKFIEMVKNDKTYIRVRGFRLFCKQARWDTDNIINQNLSKAAVILQDKKPTAVRQALAALHEVVIYKPELHSQLQELLAQIDPYSYKETMHSLLTKDIQNLLQLIDEKQR